MLTLKTYAFKHRSIALLLFSFLITVVIYSPGLGGPFLHDDYANTLHYKLTTLDWQRLLSLSFANESGMLRRPVSNASFALNFFYSGDGPWGLKLVNLIIHLFTGIVLYLFSKKLLEHVPKLKLNNQQINLVAVITTAIWLLHPLHVSTVLYIVQRMAQLSMLFTLLALYAYLLGRVRLMHNKPFAYYYILMGYGVFGLLAILSKENAALLPVYIILIELLIFRFKTAQSPTARNYTFWGVFALIAVVPIILGLTVLAMKMNQFLAGYLNRPFSLAERLLTESHVLWSYIKQYFLPQLSELALYHDDYPLQSSFDMHTILAISGLLSLVMLGIFMYRKEPLVSFGIFWFLIAHSLESTFLPLEIMYEHRNYMAMYGLLISCVYLLFRFSSNKNISVYRNIFISIFILLISFQTFSRVQLWHDKETMIRFESTFHPESYRLITELINFDLEANDYAAAHQKVKKLRQVHAWDPGAPLLDVIIDCLEGKDSSQYITESIETINKSTLSGTMPSAIHKISNAVINDNCPAVSPPEVAQIINAALMHPRVMKQPRTIQLLSVLHGRLNYKIGNNNLAKTMLLKAFQAYPSELGPLVEKGYIELNEGDLLAANATIEKLKLLNKKVSFYRYFTHRIVELESYIEQESISSKNKKIPGH